MPAATPSKTETKKIKLTTGIVGINRSHKPGDVIDLPAHEADAFVAEGSAAYHAEEIKPTDKPATK